jgi:hypothetical protein
MFSQPKRQTSPPQDEYLTHNVNTVPSFVANRAGKLTSEQMRRLRHSELETSPETQKRMRAENSRKWERTAFLLLAYGLGSILLFAIFNITITRADRILAPAAVLVLVTVAHTNKSLLDEKAANGLLRNMRVDTLNSKWAPNNIGMVEGTPKVEPLFTITIDDISFKIDKHYWRVLRQQAYENRLEPVRAYYLRDWQPAPLLSFQTVKVANALPQDDERFEYIVGIGDDGEIVYSSEV